ncbi:YndJ family protein [Actinomadura kijaniata]|uniref:YndJ family protein n=1 Tax=Actinomadura kijaniata TaxID=46161 RepID=UPI000A5640A1|nr:YndJ family protein [Actinomadura kijaniata]
MIALVNVVVVTGMLVVVPLGLRLVDVPEVVRRLWLVGAAAGAVSLWLPRGPAAVLPALVYALGAVPPALLALPRLRRVTPVRVAVATALASPAVAATALVAERGGAELFGFSLTILSLTVAHFHFAGFAAALVAGLVARGEPGRATMVAALAVPAGTLLVLVGYFLGEWVEFAGAVVLTCGMWTVAAVLVRGGPLAVVAGGVLGATMLLALSWALGEATGLPHPSLGWMVATHGVGNAFGFGVCGMLAWHRLKEESL